LIVQGKRGGQTAVFDQLVSTWLPTKAASIDVSEDGDVISVKLDGTGELNSKLVRDMEGNSFTLRGGGFVAGLGFEEVELSAPTASSINDPDLPESSFEVKSGARGAATWSG
jgi:hypothetical protein